MEIFDGDIRYRIKFSHIRTCFKLSMYKLDSYDSPQYTKVKTLCEVFTGSRQDDEVLVGKGASLVEKDHFSRLVGRYISFYRAIDNMGLNSDTSIHANHVRKILLTAFHKANSRSKARQICRDRGFELDLIIEPIISFDKYLITDGETDEFIYEFNAGLSKTDRFF